jgi:Na+/H+-dicarboxylate symporter
MFGVIVGFITGVVSYNYNHIPWVQNILIEDILATGGGLFLTIMKFFVVPTIVTSLVVALYRLSAHHTAARIGFKTIGMYILTTLLAVVLAMTVASIFNVGANIKGDLGIEVQSVDMAIPTFKDVLRNFILIDFSDILAGRNVLILVLAAMLLGFILSLCGKIGEKAYKGFEFLQTFVLACVMGVIYVSPLGVFLLVGHAFSQSGLTLLPMLAEYIGVTLLVIGLHIFIVTYVLLKKFCKLPLGIFFKKMRVAMVLAFSSDSSHVAMPVTLQTTREKLGASHTLSSLTIPLGSTINMDGGAILQGMATVFIANYFGVDLTFTHYVLIAMTTVLATIGTAALPGVGMFTLILVLQTVGLPVEGVALIIGVDRILGMLRTTVNVIGDAVITVFIASTEGELNREIYFSESAENC